MKKSISPATAAVVIVVIVVVVAVIGYFVMGKKGSPPQQETVDVQSTMKMMPMGQKMPGSGPDSPDAQIK